MKARYIRTDGARNQSLHYFHFYVIKDRVDFSHLSDVYPHTCLPSPDNRVITILPSADDDKALRRLLAVHVSRALVTYIPFFKIGFEDVVEWHIKHEHYSEMSQSSEVVSFHSTNTCVCHLQSIIIHEPNDNARVTIGTFHTGTSWCSN